MTQDHPRGGVYPTEEQLNEVKFDETYNIFKERFSNAGSFTFLFIGNFEVETIKPLLATYLGSLPSTNTEESWKDVGIRPPNGVVQKTIEKGTDPKSIVTITFTGKFDYNKDEAFKLDALVQALQIKLIEEIREKSSGVYSIGAYDDADKYPYENYSITIRFPCAPENAEKLSEGVFAEIKKLMDNGPTEVDLKKVKEAQYRDMETNLKENQFWLTTLQRYYWYGQDPVKILNYKEAIDGLSSEKLKVTANKYFDMNNYAKVVLMPEGKTSESGK
jgi:zinc protease